MRFRQKWQRRETEAVGSLERANIAVGLEQRIGSEAAIGRLLGDAVLVVFLALVLDEPHRPVGEMKHRQAGVIRPGIRLLRRDEHPASQPACRPRMGFQCRPHPRSRLSQPRRSPRNPAFHPARAGRLSRYFGVPHRHGRRVWNHLQYRGLEAAFSARPDTRPDSAGPHPAGAEPRVSINDRGCKVSGIRQARHVRAA
jgi:hypothetical protein